MDKDLQEIFKTHLYKRGLYHTTVEKYIRHVKRFKNWCPHGGAAFKKPSKDDLYAYKRDFPNIAPITWVERFSALRHWYRFMGKTVDVPYTKGIAKGKVAYDGLLDEEGLLSLYNAVPASTLVGRRNKAVVSLIVFQALDRKTISLLEPSHLNLEGGTLSVPAIARTNARILSLHPAQVPALMDYVHRCREVLLQENGIKQSPYLFAMAGGTGSFRSSVTRYLPELRKNFPDLRDWTQVRQSRIMVWIKEHPLRRAQYMAGIRHISSMRCYAQGDITELKQLIEKHHPLG
jgi:site-specific recombinase XerD